MLYKVLTLAWNKAVVGAGSNEVMAIKSKYSDGEEPSSLRLYIWLFDNILQGM